MRDSPSSTEGDRPRQVVQTRHSVPTAPTPQSQSTFGPKYGQDPPRTTGKGPTGTVIPPTPNEPEITGGAGTTPSTTPTVLNVPTTQGGGKDAGVYTGKMLPDTQTAADAAAGGAGGSGGDISFAPVINLATREVDTPFGKYAVWVLALVAFLAWRIVKKVF